MKFKIFSTVLLLLFHVPDIGAYVWPTVSKEITSDFGPRDTGTGWYWHPGIDIHADIGTSVYGGVVDWVDDLDDSNAGKWIRIDHDGGMTSRYLHLSEILVSKDEIVSAGQLIGKSGNTAGNNPVVPHLHFDFGYSASNGIHPLKYLPYDNTCPPTITNAEPLEYENGGIIVVKGVTGIKTDINTTADKDLNEVKFFVDGQEKYKISYDPRQNCTAETVEVTENVAGKDTFKWLNLDTTGLSEGTHQVEVRAIDASGGETTKSISIFVNNCTKDYLAKGMRIILENNPHEEVDYPNPAWGQEWTGTTISPGRGELEAEGLILEVLTKRVQVTPTTNIKFDLLDCEGLLSYYFHGGQAMEWRGQTGNLISG